MSQKSMRSTRTAQYYNKPSADLILRTVDGVDFRVHKQILAEASPFFASMFSLPQPIIVLHGPDGAESTSWTPIVHVSEDSPTLDLLLRLIYPISKAHKQMEDAQAMVSALEAATKYDMTLPIDIISEQLIVMVQNNPLQVWAAACRAGLESVARRAAEALRAREICQDAYALSFMDTLGDMTGISAGNYYRLKRFLTMDQSLLKLHEEPLLSPSPKDAGPSPDAASTTSAPSFFTDLPSTDVVCRSFSRLGEEAIFYAHQAVLSVHSPVLKMRLAELRLGNVSPTLGNTPVADTNGNSNTYPTAIVLGFDETPEVLSALLKTCYDSEDSEVLPADLDFLAGLLVASQRYEMGFITPRILAAWDYEAELRPLEAYFVALDHDLKVYAEDAARNVTLEEEADSEDAAYDPIMERASALDYHRLLVYHDSCCKVIEEGMLRAVDSVPEAVYYSPTDIVTDPLWTMATTRRRITKEHMRQSLYDVIYNQCISKATNLSGTTAQIWKLVGSVLWCVVRTPEELEEGIHEVKINLG